MRRRPLTGHERHSDIPVDASDVVLYRVQEGTLAILQAVDIGNVDLGREERLDLQRNS